MQISTCSTRYIFTFVEHRNQYITENIQVYTRAYIDRDVLCDISKQSKAKQTVLAGYDEANALS